MYASFRGMAAAVALCMCGTAAVDCEYGQARVIDRPADQFIYHGYAVTINVAANDGVPRSALFIFADHGFNMAQGGAPIVVEPDTRIVVKEFYFAAWNHYS